MVHPLAWLLVVGRRCRTTGDFGICYIGQRPTTADGGENSNSVINSYQRVVTGKWYPPLLGQIPRVPILLGMGPCRSIPEAGGASEFGPRRVPKTTHLFANEARNRGLWRLEAK